MKIRGAVHKSRVEVVRHDLAPIIRGLCQNMVERSEENTHRIEEQERLWKYEQAECLWYGARQTSEQPPLWVATVVSGLPERIPELTAHAARQESLEVELRFKYAHAVMAAKLVRDWDDARARAAKVKFLMQAGL